MKAPTARRSRCSAPTTRSRTVAAGEVERDGDALRFAIACEGRGAARASAVYRLLPEAFEGRIAMVMGGKNMTMTEVQSGRRIGPCS